MRSNDIKMPLSANHQVQGIIIEQINWFLNFAIFKNCNNNYYYWGSVVVVYSLSFEEINKQNYG